MTQLPDPARARRMVGLSMLALLASVLPGVALAEEEDTPEKIRLTYVAPEPCPGEGRFVALVQARSRKVQIAPDDAGARVFVVRLVPHANHATASLTIVDADGRTSTRELTGTTCVGVARAAALVIALAADPTAVGAEPAPEAEPSPAEPEARPPESTSALAPVAARSAASPPRAAAPPALGTPPAPARVGWRLALGGGAQHGVAAAISGSIHASTELEYRASRRFAPSTRLSFHHAFPGEFSSAAGNAKLTWTAGRLELCPVRFSGGALSFAPCALGELGTQHGRGIDVSPSRAGGGVWAALGASARARLALGHRFFVEATAGARLPLASQRFTLQPATTVYDAPRVSGFVDVALGVRVL